LTPAKVCRGAPRLPSDRVRPRGLRAPLDGGREPTHPQPRERLCRGGTMAV